MTTLPEEAVKAAMDAFHEAWNNNQGRDNELPAYAHRTALTAALPFLSALEPSAARGQALEEAAQVAEMLPECDLLSVNGNEVSPAVNDAFKRGAFAQGKAIAAAIRALSSPDHADAGKVEGDGWRPGCDRLPTLQEAAFAAKVLNACNGYDLSVWTDDLWPCDDAFEGLRAIIAHSVLPSAPSEGAE